MACSSTVEQAPVKGKVAGSSPAVPVNRKCGSIGRAADL